ncbi:MAG: carboxypeptidase-like regulatory domain-containing protein [Longimicrobiales bacterium]|nr:carboxypeptidase-like regulatory domain-containing protein [Longimicrobiales bacterium]
MKRTLLFSLLALALCAGPARAQIVRGQVVEDVTNTPVEGAMVVVLDVGGHVVRRVLTNATGGFIVHVEAPGEYHIRVDRIGYESLTTGGVDVPVEGTFQRIAVPIQPIELEGLEIEGSPRCRLRNEQGEATARAWEEARKALEAAAWTLSSGVYRYTLLQFERTLEPTLHTVLTEKRRFARGTGQAPYVSAPASELVAQGFVRQNPDRTLTYYAPDAAAFLSDEFLDTHCMALESVRDGLVGLAFQPVRGRRQSDIRGTLWIEAATATLRKLEFTYVNLPPGQDLANAGGEVIFGRLPNGTWIVREWSIRMPRVTTTPDRQRVVVNGYEVQGGVVWRVTDQNGRTLVEAETATVSGTVLDSLGSGPVAGVRVRAGDGAAEALTTGEGSFFLPGLAAGLQNLEVSHPSLDSLGLGPVHASVVASAGEMASARVRLPGVEETLEEACGGTPDAARETAIVFARVRRAGSPVEGTPVRALWLGTGQADFRVTPQAAPPLAETDEPQWRADPNDARWIRTTLDARGIFMLCGIPTRSQVKLEVGTGEGAQPHTVTVPAGARVVFVPVTIP